MEWTRLTDWLFSEQILCIIGTFAPHLLRYIAVVAILNKQRQDHFKATVDIISKTFLKTPDHFVSIIDSLFLKFDIEQAQEKLAYCEKAAKADFLLVPLEKYIEEHARLLIFQTYCRIQKSINIEYVVN
jgi:translation initiation factor 3 subunit E